MNDPATDLAARAHAGDPAAMTAYGKRLLAGDGVAVSVAEGAQFMTRAAQAGSGEAHAQLAVFAAAGIGRQPDWNESLAHLRRAADLGWQQSARELALLQGNGAAIDVRAWMQPRPLETVFESPRIRIGRGFLTAAECQWLIERGSPKLGRARVYTPNAGATAIDEARSNSAMEFNLTDMDVVLVLLHARMSASTGLPARMFGLPNLLHYAPGQEFTPHYDFFELGEEHGPTTRKHQRIATLLFYLNDDYEGGETDFPRVPYRFKGAIGDALMFANVDRAGKPDYATLHAGMPPTRGEKWMFTQWVRASA